MSLDATAQEIAFLAGKRRGKKLHDARIGVHRSEGIQRQTPAQSLKNSRSVSRIAAS